MPSFISPPVWAGVFCCLYYIILYRNCKPYFATFTSCHNLHKITIVCLYTLRIYRAVQSCYNIDNGKGNSPDRRTLKTKQPEPLQDTCGDKPCICRPTATTTRRRTAPKRRKRRRNTERQTSEQHKIICCIMPLCKRRFCKWKTSLKLGALNCWKVKR